MIDITQIAYFTSYLLPIPFMALFFIKTHKLDFLKKYGILTLFIPILAQLYLNNLGFSFPLVLGYWILILLGTSLFNSKGYTIPQSLSISFCLTYFGSLLWETPIIVYTAIIRGGIDGAFPLHIIYIFPMLLIYEKLKTNQPKKEIATILTWTLSYSVLILAVLVLGNYNIWIPAQNSISKQGIEQFLWMTTRILVITGLFAIYAKSTLRKEIKK